MDTLKKETVWVCWKHDPEKGKIPKNPKTGGNAQSNNKTTWASYELAEATREKYDGIGFMFAGDICGIDIDGINDPKREEQAKEILAHMDTYTEYSPSRNGYHLIFRCDVSKIPHVEENGRIKLDPAYYQKNPHNGVECYISGLTHRFFTYTGEAVNVKDVEDRTKQLLTFLDKYMKKSPIQHPTVVRGDGAHNHKNDYRHNNDILSIARRAKNSNKFISLFDNGDTSAYNGDDSSADIALCNILAFYTGGNIVEIDRLFRESKLMRSKWEREDYRLETINKAIRQCGNEFYKPQKKENKVALKSNQQKKIFKIFAKLCDGAIRINPFETLEAKNRYGWNDIGAGYLFADVYKNVSRYVPEAKLWYVYDGRVWKQDVGGVIVSQQAKDLIFYLFDCCNYLKGEDAQKAQEWISFVAKRIEKKARDTMIADAASVHWISIKEFDKNIYLFNCQNCTLDLENFTKRKHRPGDFLSKISNVVFDENARCDRWTQYQSGRAYVR